MPGSRSISYKVNTQFMVDFLGLHIARTGALQRGISFSKSDFEQLSDIEYLKGISESVGIALSTLHVWILREIYRNSNTKKMKELLQVVSVMYGHNIDIDDFVDSLRTLMMPRAKTGMFEQLDGGNKRKMLGFLFQFVQLYGIYLMVTSMSRSLEQRTANSVTSNAIIELMSNSNCKKPELNPLLGFIASGLSDNERNLLIAAKMTDSAFSEGGCVQDEYAAAIKGVLFAEDDVGKYSGQETQKYSSALVMAGPNSVVLADLTENAASKKIKTMSVKSGSGLFDTYLAVVKSANHDDFKKQLVPITDMPLIVNIKEQPTMLGAAAYVFEGIGDQVKIYWSDVRDFGLLNPIPLDDVWRELKQEARRRILLYQRLVEDGRMAMETANDELWAWIKHASILFLLTKTGVCLGFSLMISLMKELNSWRKGTPAIGMNSRTVIGKISQSRSQSKPGSRSQSPQSKSQSPQSKSQSPQSDPGSKQLTIRKNGGKRTRKIRKRAF